MVSLEKYNKMSMYICIGSLAFDNDYLQFNHLYMHVICIGGIRKKVPSMPDSLICCMNLLGVSKVGGCSV